MAIKAKNTSTLIISSLEEKEKRMKELVHASLKTTLKKIVATEPVVYYRLRYTPCNKEFTELKQIIDMLNHAKGLQENYDGVMLLDITEYLGHEQEEYFTVLLKWIYDMANVVNLKAHFCLTTNSNRDSEAKIYGKILEYLEADLKYDLIQEAVNSADKAAESLAKAYAIMDKLRPADKTAVKTDRYGQFL